jgi:hypothetical protein
MESRSDSRAAKEIAVDQRVYEIAKHFLLGNVAELGEPPPTISNQRSLAVAIQQAVEDWFLAEEIKLASGELPEVDRG